MGGLVGGTLGRCVLGDGGGDGGVGGDLVVEDFGAGEEFVEDCEAVRYLVVEGRSDGEDNVVCAVVDSADCSSVSIRYVSV